MLRRRVAEYLIELCVKVERMGIVTRGGVKFDFSGAKTLPYENKHR